MQFWVGDSIGILPTQTVKLLGAAKVLIADVSSLCLEIAKKVGADFAVNTREKDFGEVLVEVFGADKADIIYY